MIPLELNYDAVARPERIRTLFQPLVSIKNRRIIALEALSRGFLPEVGVTLPPGLLFNLAPDRQRALALDRLCREAAMLRFHPLHVKRRDLLLTVNLDMSLIDRETLGSGRFAKAALDAGLSPENVVIEIIESKVEDVDVLEEFITRHRDMGFLIALDDIGAGHSNLDRIPSIKPDVIKIDRGLISGIHEEYHKFEIVRALTRLGRNIGAMIVAEGVEKEAEVLRLLELGVDIFQGFYFARPEPAEGLVPPVPETVSAVAKRFHQQTIDSINRRGSMHAAYDRAMNLVANTLSQAAPRQFDPHLARALHSHPDIECLYVLNLAGRQVSATMCNPDVIPEHRRFIYQPAPKGTDHSLKEYYLPIRAGLPRFTTEPYISMASGNQCITISAPFTDAKERGFILCMDIGLHDQLAFGPALKPSGPRLPDMADAAACLCMGKDD